MDTTVFDNMAYGLFYFVRQPLRIEGPRFFLSTLASILSLEVFDIIVLIVT